MLCKIPIVTVNIINLFNWWLVNMEPHIHLQGQFLLKEFCEAHFYCPQKFSQKVLSYGLTFFPSLISINLWVIRPS